MLSKTLYAVYVSLLLSITASAQKVIVIDTLDFWNKPADIFGSCGLVGIYCGDTVSNCYYLDNPIQCKEKWYSNDYPNLVAVVDEVDFLDYISVIIRLDNKGGRLKLLNIDKVKGDTIHISKWSVFENKLGGYEIGYKLFYKKVNDSMLFDGVPYNGELIDDHYSAKADTLRNIAVTINGQEYDIPLTLDSSDMMSTFHGYIPLRRYNRYLKYYYKHEEPLKRKFRYDYFWGTVNRVNYIYEGVLDLSNVP